MANLGPELVAAYKVFVSSNGAILDSGSDATPAPADLPAIEYQGGLVGLDVKSAGGDFSRFVSTLESLGMQITASSPEYGLVEGWAPPSELPAIAQSPQTMSGAPIYVPLANSEYQGVGNNEAQTALAADAARSQFGVDGTGVTVGVLSNSVNQYNGGLSQSYATGDLNPSNPVRVIEDAPPGLPNIDDEGRAMLESIHDIAPGASLQFATAALGEVSFAQNIRALAQAGSNIIVDDIGYADEPMFQDGVIAQAVDAVTATGVSYFSAAGNAGPDGGYLSAFRAASATVPGIGSGTFMNFNPQGGTNVFLPITTGIPDASISFQYDQPYRFQEPAGSPGVVTSNVNIYVINAATGAVVVGPDQNQNNVEAGQPLQMIQIPQPGSYYVAIQVVSGPHPQHVEFVSNNDAVGAVTVSQQYKNAGATSYPTSFGHGAAAATIGVGATPWWAPAPFVGQNPLESEPFSSSGPNLIDLSPEGTPISPILVLNPTITAPDGENTSFFSPQLFIDTANPPFPGQPASPTDLVPALQQNLPSFFGTSAAAPNAAAVAALMKQEVPSLAPAQVRADLIASASPLNGANPGTWDPQAGYGLISAVAALSALAPSPGLPTGLVLGASNLAPNFMQPVTLTALVNPTQGGSEIPSGSVDFVDTATNTDLGSVALQNRNASIITTPSVAGTHVILVVYSGDTNFAPTTGYLTLTIMRGPTVTHFAVSPNPSNFGQVALIEVTVQAVPTSFGTPTGIVDFFDNTGGFKLGSLKLVDGSSTQPLEFPLGTTSITATYSGDPNFLPSSSNLNVVVLASVLVLDPTAGSAMNISGGAAVNVPGSVVVDSDATSALTATGSAAINAGSIGVVGGVGKSGNPTLNPTPITGAPAEPDPLAVFGFPPLGAFSGSVNLGGSSSETINPGTYTAISVSGNARLRLNPGNYIIAGGGLSVSGSASITVDTAGPPNPITGTGVLIYNAGSDFPKPGGTFGAITVSGAAQLNLVGIGPANGFLSGLVIVQSRDNPQTISISGSGQSSLNNGIIYAPAATLSLSGAAQLLGADVDVDELQVQGSASVNGAGDDEFRGLTPQLSAVQSDQGHGPIPLQIAPLIATSSGAMIFSGASTKKSRISAVNQALAGGLTRPTVKVALDSGAISRAAESRSLVDLESLGDVAVSLATVSGSETSTKKVGTR